MSFDTVIEMEDLARHYEMGGVTIKALDGVDLSIFRGEYLSIVGPSGSGKTTLFNLIGGLDRPSRGHVHIDGVDISQLDAYELAWLRCRKIGYIFQTFNLITVLTALENVALPTLSPENIPLLTPRIFAQYFFPPFLPPCHLYRGRNNPDYLPAPFQ